MKRAPIVLGSTVVGLASVLGFHTHGTTVPLVQSTAGSATSGTTSSSSGSGSSGSSGTSSSSGASTTTVPSSRGQSSSPSSSSSSSSTATTTTSPSTSGTRSATGAAEQTQYGVVQLKVTVSNNRVTQIQAVQLTAYDQLSAQINAAAEPMLTQEAMQAQNANISSISGASYTSAAYIASLQSALDKLGIK